MSLKKLLYRSMKNAIKIYESLCEIWTLKKLSWGERRFHIWRQILKIWNSMNNVMNWISSWRTLHDFCSSHYRQLHCSIKILPRQTDLPGMQYAAECSKQSNLNETTHYFLRISYSLELSVNFLPVFSSANKFNLESSQIFIIVEQEFSKYYFHFFFDVFF